MLEVFTIVAATSSTCLLFATVLGLLPLERATKKEFDSALAFERMTKRLDIIEARITVPKLDEAARRKELAERSVAYADQLGGARAQRLAHALAAFRLMSPQNASIPDNVARIEIEAVLARRKPPPAPGAGEKRVAP